MIKLIASDIDGTLIPYGERELPQGLFSLIRRLKAAGVLFCPASGRQYHSLRQLFAPVADEVCFLCENGAILYGPGEEDAAPILAKTAMPQKQALELARDILALPGCEVLISGANTSYVCDCAPEYVTHLRKDKDNRAVVLSDVSQVPEEILKVSAYCPNGTDAPQAALGPRWSALGMAVAGPDWLDFTLADKGVGLRGLCGALGVKLEETAAFGDNWNDAAMLSLAGQAWLMDTAHPELLRRFPRHCKSVPAILEAILEELEG